jgi:translation initiation factor 1
MQKKRSHIVYSTDPDYIIENTNEEPGASIPPSQQKLRIWLEKRPGGKNVSIIRGFMGPKSELQQLAKIVKTRCHCGGTVKNGEVILQGNQRERIEFILISLNYQVKLSGG